MSMFNVSPTVPVSLEEAVLLLPATQHVPFLCSCNVTAGEGDAMYITLFGLFVSHTGFHTDLLGSRFDKIEW